MASEKRIGGKTYRCEPLTGRDPWQLLADLKNLFAPLGALIGTADAETVNKELTSIMAAEMIGAVGALDDKGVLDMMERLVGLATCDGKQCVWGVHPSSMNDTLEVVSWVLQVQFSDFFGGSALTGLLAMLPSEAKSAR